MGCHLSMGLEIAGYDTEILKKYCSPWESVLIASRKMPVHEGAQLSNTGLISQRCVLVDLTLPSQTHCPSESLPE